tara:strand:+ start:476 stop:1642 length:1167 start_codon:yes stop_codon:yes gene_type:complete
MKSDLVLDKKPKRGFLPDHAPLRYVRSDSQTRYLSDLSKEVPKLLLTSSLPDVIESLPENFFNFNEMIKSAEEKKLRCIYSQLSFLAHAYIYSDNKPRKKLPKSIASPWVRISKYLGRPPVLSYASYCLDNWYLIDKDKDISLDNVALINNFLGGVDEDWFVTVHVCIENAASEAISSSIALIDETSESKIEMHLNNILESLKEVNHIFKRMPEKCDPYIYYHRVRPYIFGWKNNPDLPKGLIYDGLFKNRPQQFRGETGAQSSIIPLLDALFSVKHKKDSLRDYLEEMLLYMPPAHQELIFHVKKSSKVKMYANESIKIRRLVNKCLDQMTQFRSQHIKYANDYIHSQSRNPSDFTSGGSTIRGTGGTPFMRYLRKHRDETKSSIKK